MPSDDDGRTLIRSTITSMTYRPFEPPQFDNFSDVLKCTVDELDGLRFSGAAIVFTLLLSVIQRRHPHLRPDRRTTIAELLTENATFCELWKREGFDIGYPADDKKMADLLKSLIGLHFRLRGYGLTLLWINDNFGLLVDTLANFKILPRARTQKKRRRRSTQSFEEAVPKRKNRKYDPLPSHRAQPGTSMTDSAQALSTITNSIASSSKL
ncbi:hypothetical protein Hypma_002527 [Hypsizygus marmoreus]|uniref:Uncharacterized protein n=1 Tax=Hypsizygus marmoreus TaxID=39966 RepID=A0A369JDG0_HYPMA|nr:hypothetical protein Hypma_002527 [Hypsizygus marmoreus]